MLQDGTRRAGGCPGECGASLRLRRVSNCIAKVCGILETSKSWQELCHFAQSCTVQSTALMMRSAVAGQPPPQNRPNLLDTSLGVRQTHTVLTENTTVPFLPELRSYADIRCATFCTLTAAQCTARHGECAIE